MRLMKYLVCIRWHPVRNILQIDVKNVNDKKQKEFNAMEYEMYVLMMLIKYTSYVRGVFDI